MAAPMVVRQKQRAVGELLVSEKDYLETSKGDYRRHTRTMFSTAAQLVNGPSGLHPQELDMPIRVTAIAVAGHDQHGRMSMLKR